MHATQDEADAVTTPFTLGEQVFVRDHDGIEWQAGVVTCTVPLMVQAFDNEKAFEWNQVRKDGDRNSIMQVKRKRVSFFSAEEIYDVPVESDAFDIDDFIILLKGFTYYDARCVLRHGSIHR